MTILQGPEMHTGVFSPGPRPSSSASWAPSTTRRTYTYMGRRGPPEGTRRSYLLGAPQVDARQGPRHHPVRLLLQVNYYTPPTATATTRRGSSARGEEVEPLPPPGAQVHGPAPRRPARPAGVPDSCIVNICDVRRLHPAARGPPRLPPPLVHRLLPGRAAADETDHDRRRRRPQQQQRRRLQPLLR